MIKGVFLFNNIMKEFTKEEKLECLDYVEKRLRLKYKEKMSSLFLCIIVDMFICTKLRETNNFHKVNLICKSPNHWGENQVGNLHYMFMLDDCKSDSSIRSFHNENLLPDLLKHRKVMEVLGATNMIESNEKQLSGIGFNSTVKDELIVKLKGSHNRMLKIKF